MSYAMIEKDGIAQSVTKTEFEAIILQLDTDELVKLILALADQVGRLRGAEENLGPLH